MQTCILYFILYVQVFGPLVTMQPFSSDEEAVALANGTRYGLAASVWSSHLHRAHSVAAQLDAGTVWVNCWLHRELHMPFGGLKASGVAREGGLHSLDFYSEASTVCVKLGDGTPPPMPGGPRRAAGPTAAPQRRGIHTSSRRGPSLGPRGGRQAGLLGPCAARRLGGMGAKGLSGMVEGAPKPLGAYTHARETQCGLLFLAGIGPRMPENNAVPGGDIEGPDGLRRDYDAGAQTRQCIANVRRVLAASGLELGDVVDVQAFLVDMKRDFAAFNAEYAAAFGGLPTRPTRTTVEVGELPPGGRIAVELKVVAQRARAA